MSQEINHIRIEGIDVAIQIIFKREHIPLLVPHFQTVGIDMKILDEVIDAYIASGENVSYERWFLEYGQNVINSMMNQRLKRDKDHPTFNNMLRYALKVQLETDATLLALNKFKANS